MLPVAVYSAQQRSRQRPDISLLGLDVVADEGALSWAPQFTSQNNPSVAVIQRWRLEIVALTSDLLIEGSTTPTAQFLRDLPN